MALLGRLICLAMLVLSGTSAAQDVRGGLAPPAQHNRVVAQVSIQPMTFFIVTGGTDSCGRGCSRWIAAEGKFESDTGKRFKDFIAVSGRRYLPVFFHAPGGNLAAALEVASLLRENRMTAGIGRTIPRGCTAFGKGVFSCQLLMDKGGEVHGALQESAGVCLSGCVYAFAGASTRRVSPGAILGVHSARLDQQAVRKLSKEDAAKVKQLKAADVHKRLRRDLLQWGVDPGLEEITEKVSPARMYILSRAEIDRLGLETRDFFETRWFVYSEAPAPPAVTKAVTLVAANSPKEHGTIQITMACDGGLLVLRFRRELPISTPWSTIPHIIRISIGDLSKPLSPERSAPGEVSWTLMDRAFSQAVSASKTIRFELALGNAALSRFIDVSTVGLSEQLVALRKGCLQAS